MEIASADEDAVETRARIQPPGEVEGRLDEEELAVRIPRACRDVGELSRDVEQEEGNEPLVLEVVPIPELATEVEGLGRGGGRQGKGKGLVLPDVGGGQGRDGGEDVVPEGLQVQGEVRKRGREGGVREDGVEHRVFGKAGAAVREDRGKGVGVEGRPLRWRRHGEARGKWLLSSCCGN